MSEVTRCPRPKFLGEPQSSRTRCWLAGYIMMFRWGGMEDSKIEGYVLDRLKGAGIDINDAFASGLKRKDNKTAGQALGLGVRGYGQPVTANNLRELVRYSPVWASGQWYETSNHVYVIVGVSDKEVELYDPWYDHDPLMAMQVQTLRLDWVLHGDGDKCKGLAHTFQSFPLQYFGG